MRRIDFKDKLLVDKINCVCNIIASLASLAFLSCISLLLFIINTFKKNKTKYSLYFKIRFYCSCFIGLVLAYFCYIDCFTWLSTICSFIVVTSLANTVLIAIAAMFLLFKNGFTENLTKAIYNLIKGYDDD